MGLRPCSVRLWTCSKISILISMGSRHIPDPHSGAIEGFTVPNMRFDASLVPAYPSGSGDDDKDESGRTMKWTEFMKHITITKMHFVFPSWCLFSRQRCEDNSATVPVGSEEQAKYCRFRARAHGPSPLWDVKNEYSQYLTRWCRTSVRIMYLPEYSQYLQNTRLIC